jgi:hypothetical protein
VKSAYDRPTFGNPVQMQTGSVYLVLFFPIILRATDNPQLLTCCVNDEAPLSMALDGMRAFPYGDPFNFVLGPVKGTPLPDYWGKLNHAGVGYYYGGAYVRLAFLAYEPLQVLGLPPFPTAPIILRLVSTLSGLISPTTSAATTRAGLPRS